MNFNSLYTTYEYGKYSTRGKSDLVTKDSQKTSGLDKDYILNGVMELMKLLHFSFPISGAEHASRLTVILKLLQHCEKTMPGNISNSFRNTGEHSHGLTVLFM